VQQIFHISKRKWEPNIHHDSQTDDLWARLKVAKWAAFCHPAKLSGCPAHLNKFCSDSADRAAWLDAYSGKEWGAIAPTRAGDNGTQNRDYKTAEGGDPNPENDNGGGNDDE